MAGFSRNGFLVNIMLLGSVFSMEPLDHKEKTSEPKRFYKLIPSIKSESLKMALGKVQEVVEQIDPGSLPSKIDFSHQFPKIHTQGDLGSCTGQALTGVLEVLLSQKMDYTQLSPMFIYYNERKLMGTIKEDSGACLSDGIRAICTWGVCSEKTWPYSDDKKKFKMKPSKNAYREGKKCMILSSLNESQVPYSLKGIKFALSKNIPVAFGVYVYPSFEHAPGGRIPIPSVDESPLGGHAMFFVGYDDDKQEFKFANSWGSEWGDNGFGYLPYDFVMNKSLDGNQKLFFKDDLWGIEKVGKEEEELSISSEESAKASTPREKVKRNLFYRI